MKQPCIYKLRLVIPGPPQFPDRVAPQLQYPTIMASIFDDRTACHNTTMYRPLTQASSKTLSTRNLPTVGSLAIKPHPVDLPSPTTDRTTSLVRDTSKLKIDSVESQPGLVIKLDDVGAQIKGVLKAGNPVFQVSE